jgi:two-component sensor histidine kinase
LHCEFRSDACILPREICQKLGLIVDELVINAAKHAFIGRGYGRIGICLRRTQYGWVFQVVDNGSGFSGGRAGRGTKMVQELAFGLGGELRIHSDLGGVMVALSLPDPTFPRATPADATPAPCHP